MDTTKMIKYGFEADTDNKVLSDLFLNNKKFKKVFVSVGNGRNALLARYNEDNVKAGVDANSDNLYIEDGGNRLSSFPMKDISISFYKKHGDNKYQFEFMIFGLYYSLLVCL